MKININKIPEDELNLQFEKDEGWFSRLLPESERNSLSAQKVDVVCSLRRIGETVFVNGRFDTLIITTCSLCLDIARFPIENVFRFTLLPVSESFSEEQELTVDDIDIFHYKGDFIDLDVIIFEQIMLQIPMRILCKETCKGLCAHCGVDLNTANCDCSLKFVDKRFAILKKLKKEG